MFRSPTLARLVGLVLHGLIAVTAQPAGAPLTWHSLPALPDREGFAGSFAGVSSDALLVAGGANFPEKRPWEGGAKIWYDHIFVLEPNAPTWRDGGHLPAAGGYGLAVNATEGMVLVGGGDAKRSMWRARLSEVYRYEAGRAKLCRDRPNTAAFGNWGILGAVRAMADARPDVRVTARLLAGRKARNV